MTGQMEIRMLQAAIHPHLPAIHNTQVLHLQVHQTLEAMLEMPILENSTMQDALASAKCQKEIKYSFQVEMKRLVRDMCPAKSAIPNTIFHTLSFVPLFQICRNRNHHQNRQNIVILMKKHELDKL